MAENNGDDASFLSLLNKARAGDREALGRLLEGFQSYLEGIARKWRSGPVTASDLVQMTMAKATKDIEAFRGKTRGEFMGWIGTILRHTFPRPNGRKPPVPLPDDPIADGRDTPCTEAQKKERLLAMAAALKRLSPRDQEIVRLRQQGLTFAEIGAQLGAPGDTIRKAWAAAIVELKEMLGGTLDSGV